VDADHLKGDAACVRINGRDTIAEQAPGVVTRNDHGKIQHTFHRFLLVRCFCYLGAAISTSRFLCRSCDTLRAGMPTMVLSASTESTTTEFAPTVTLSPMWIPPRIFEPAPRTTLSPTSGRSRKSNPKSILFAPRVTPWRMMALRPMRQAPTTVPEGCGKKIRPDLAARRNLQAKKHNVEISQQLRQRGNPPEHGGSAHAAEYDGQETGMQQATE